MIKTSDYQKRETVKWLCMRKYQELGENRGEEREEGGRDGQHGRRLDPVKTCCQQVIHAVEKPEDFKE